MKALDASNFKAAGLHTLSTATEFHSYVWEERGSCKWKLQYGGDGLPF